MSEYQPLKDAEGGSDDLESRYQQQQQGNWTDNMANFGKELGKQMTVVGGKISEQVNVVGDKMKEMFHQPTLGERLVDEATAEALIAPDWDKNLQICDLITGHRLPRNDVMKGIKRRLTLKNGHVQLLALTLLETTLKNCTNMFPEVASEKLLDSMVRLVDDPTTPVVLREKCLKMIEAWGEATEELRYLPVFEETYKSLKNRGIVFPPRDAESLAPIFTPPPSVRTAAAAAVPPAAAHAPHGQGVPVDVAVPAGVFAVGGGLAPPGIRQVNTPQGPLVVIDSKEVLSVARNTTELLSTVLSSAPPEEVLKDEVTQSLEAQCRASKMSVQQLVENESSNETLLFEALTVNDELDKVLEKLHKMQVEAKPPTQPPAEAAAATGQPSSQMADLLAPPPPVTAFPVPSMEHEPDGETLLRKRTGTDAAPGAAHVSEDEKALAELDAMVFGKPAPTSASSAAPAPAPVAAGATAQGSSTGQADGKKDSKDDDLIVF